MDQDGGSRRRSSRLAARGVVVTPKADASLKKMAKSSEKSKRAKRKTTEEVIELPDAKKTKTEDKLSTDEVDNPKEKKTNNVKKNEVPAIKPVDSTPMDVDNVEETNVKTNEKPVEKETDTLIEDSKDQEDVSEKNTSDAEDKIALSTGNNEEKKVTLVDNDGEAEDKTGDEEEKANDKEENAEVEEKIPSETGNDVENVILATDDNKEKIDDLEEKTDDKEEQVVLPSIDEKNVELSTNNETEKVSLVTNYEEEKNSLKTSNDEESEVSDKPKEEPVIVEIVNGNDDIKETKTDEPIEEIVKNNIAFSVTTKIVGTPNGDTVDQVKSTNGNKSDTESEEQKKVLNDNTNHVETDLKAALTTANVAITPSKDTSSIEQGEKEIIKEIDNTVDNTSVSDGDNTPKTVDQSPTVVS